MMRTAATTRKLAPLAAAVLMLAASSATASALDVKPLELEMMVGGKPFTVTAEPLSTWQTSSEGQLSLDQKFDIQPDGSHGLIQVKLAPAPPQASASAQPNPCILLQGLGQALQKEGLRVSPGRKPQANLAPVCSMIAEGSLKTQFYYASIFKTGDVIVAGVARNGSDLDETQITDFQRYLTSIKATPKETTQ